MQWDQDPEKTGLPDQGEDTKQYETTATSGTVTVTHDETGSTRTLDFTLPLNGGGTAELTANPATVDSTGDEAARTITVSGTGFEADGTGTVELIAGAPGEAGDALVTANVATDADGAFSDVQVIVPANQTAGDYHLVATVGASSSDDTAITVTGGAGDIPEVTPDVTEVEAGGTVTLAGTGFPADTEGIAELVPGAPGETGEPVATVEFTTDAEGAFTAAALVVPEGTADGGYHVVTTVGSVVADDTAITVGAAEGPVTTPDVTEVEAGGTVTVAGTGYPADTAGTVALLPGAPGSGGTAVVTADITTDAEGAFADAALAVPAGTADGEYHLVTTVGTVVSDDTAITVGAGGDAGTITPDVTEVDSTGTEAARTITVAGEGFDPETEGTVELRVGAPGNVDGPLVANSTVTTDAAGAFTGATLVVPADQPAAEYHLVAVVGATTSDDTAITVTGGAAPATAVMPARTDVPSAGNEAERTVQTFGEGFPAETAGTVELLPGAPGSGGTAVVSVPVETDVTGQFLDAMVIVPEAQAAGDYHLVTTVGATTFDETPITVVDAPALAVPVNPAVTGQTATSLDVTVDPVTDATAYEYRYWEPGYSNWRNFEESPTPAYTITGLESGQTYEMKVRALGDGTANVSSLWSEMFTGTTSAAAAASTKTAAKKRKK